MSSVIAKVVKDQYGNLLPLPGQDMVLSSNATLLGMHVIKEFNYPWSVGTVPVPSGSFLKICDPEKGNVYLNLTVLGWAALVGAAGNTSPDKTKVSVFVIGSNMTPVGLIISSPDLYKASLLNVTLDGTTLQNILVPPVPLTNNDTTHVGSLDFTGFISPSFSNGQVLIIEYNTN